MAKATKILLTALLSAFIFYLILPAPLFPEPPAASLQSDEPADTETPLRRAYFTNDTRQEVIAHYRSQFLNLDFFPTLILTYKLNYPPEDAKTLIRDQTRSTFLEEIVHPFRESIFVNGFEPKDPKDAILIGGRNWRQKIIIRYVPSSGLVRLFLGIASAGLIVLVYKGWKETLSEVRDLGLKK